MYENTYPSFAGIIIARYHIYIAHSTLGATEYITDIYVNKSAQIELEYLIRIVKIVIARISLPIISENNLEARSN